MTSILGRKGRCSDLLTLNLGLCFDCLSLNLVLPLSTAQLSNQAEKAKEAQEAKEAEDAKEEMVPFSQALKLLFEGARRFSGKMAKGQKGTVKSPSGDLGAKMRKGGKGWAFTLARQETSRYCIQVWRLERTIEGIT